MSALSSRVLNTHPHFIQHRVSVTPKKYKEGALQDTRNLPFLSFIPHLLSALPLTLLLSLSSSFLSFNRIHCSFPSCTFYFLSYTSLQTCIPFAAFSH